MFSAQAALSKVGKKPLLRSGNRCLTIKTKKEMKKNLFMVAAVALVALVSCNKETNSSLQPAPVSDIKFEAEIAQTKTSIGAADENGYRNVTWNRDDKVNINGTLFTATGFKEDGKAIFETEDLGFAVAEQYDAIYPATAGKSLEAVTIPTEQDGTFANAAIAVAQSENRSLSFLNVASLLRFQVPAAYASVTIESTANLAGTVSVSFNEELPVIGEVKNASKTVTLKNVKAGVDYYVAILPGDHKFTFNIDGRLSKEATTTLTATRAGILALGVLPEPVVAENAVIRINNMNGWDSLNITVKSGNTTLANAQEMTAEGNNIFYYELDSQYVGQSVTYFITYSWYQTSNKTVTLAAKSESTAINLNTTYLQPGAWGQDSATFGAWMWGTGVTDTMVTGVKTQNDFFEFEIPAAGYKNIIFLRCHKDNAVADWNRVWNKTGDLTLQHKCYCIQESDAWKEPTGNYWY